MLASYIVQSLTFTYSFTALFKNILRFTDDSQR